MLNSQDGARQLISTNLGANPHHLQPFFFFARRKNSGCAEPTFGVRGAFPRNVFWEQVSRLICESQPKTPFPASTQAGEKQPTWQVSHTRLKNELYSVRESEEQVSQ